MPARQTTHAATTRTVYFAAPRRWGRSALEALLTETCPELRCEGQRRETRVEYLDTFDWLLLRASRIAEQHFANGTHQLVLRGFHQAPRRAAAPLAAGCVQPARVAGRFLRAELLRLCGERALLPLVTVNRSETLLTLCDVAGKQRLRVELRDERNAGRTRRATRQRLMLAPLAGYPEEARGVREALIAAGWQAAEEPLLEALRAAGREPFDYPPAASVALRPDMPARDAVSLIGLRLLEVMQANLEGLRADWDVEFLHDFRVALRRTRTLLAQVRDVLPAARVRRFKNEFGWLGGISGAARDGDVQVEEIRLLVAARPETERVALEPLRTWIRAHREQTREGLLKALDSRRFARLCEDWRSLLEHRPTRTRLANAARPIGTVSAQRIQAVFDHVLRKGARIDDGSPPAHLHELRKDAKKLRYLIEFFRPLHDTARVDVLVSDLKRLQENLGEYQDLEVQRTMLERFAATASPRTATVLAGVEASMRTREARVRNEFGGRFNAFSAASVRRHLRAMLNARVPAARS